MGDSNIPVRLIGQDGSVYQLMVTTLTMDVDRKIIGSPLPFTGSERVTYDGNLSTAMITLEGYITDNDIIHINSGGNQASAYIDYSYTSFSGDTIPWSGWVSTIVKDLVTDNYSNLTHGFKINVGGEKTIWFAKSTSAHGPTGDPNEYFIQVHDGALDLSMQDIATNTAQLLNTFPAYLTASVVNSTETSHLACKVLITKATIGESGNSNYPNFSQNKWGSHASYPNNSPFSGGTDAGFDTGMSAGDKVMELYSILNNSVDDTGNSGELRDSQGRLTREAISHGKYIIGLQIPFNSTHHATGGDKYSARNFFMSAGWNDEDEISLDKALPAGTDFNIADFGFTRSGIGGTVDKATFVQIGGEPIYQFTILFVPTNHII